MCRLFEYSKEKLFIRSACGRFHNKFSFVVMADSQIDNDPHATAVFQAALKMAARYDPLFILHCGDIVRTGKSDSFAYFLALLNQIPEIYDIPLFVVAGNHECSIKDIDSYKYFKQMIGPLNFTISLPTQQLTICGINTADYRADPNSLAGLNYSLQRYDQLVKIVAMHIPPHAGTFKDFTAFSQVFHPVYRSNTFIDGTPDLLHILGIHQVAMAFSGHIHAYLPAIINLPDCPGPNPITGQAAIPWIVTGGAGATLIPGFSFHFLVITVKVQDNDNFTCQVSVVPIYV